MRHTLAQRLPDIWQDKTHPVSKLLYPLSLIYGVVMKFRRILYKSGVFKSVSVNVPVIVVGNITVGGTGKTPLVVWLNDFLLDAGLKVGIISRGYGGSSPNWPIDVTPFEKPEIVGDEAMMMRHKVQTPIAVSPTRSEAAQMLIDKYQVDIIISDDGLQHLALNRDLEIIVIDAKRQFGNNRLLPSGPLREPESSISEQAIKVYSASVDIDNHTYWVKISPVCFRNVRSPNVSKELTAFKDTQVNAMAAIGYPDKFFQMLKSLNIRAENHSFPDHHYYQAKDLIFENNLPLVMTEKDAVKCKDLVDDNAWYLQIQSIPNRKFKVKLDEFISGLRKST